MLNHCVVMITKRLYKMSESVGTRPAERTEKVQTCHKGGPNVPSSISPQRNVAQARSVGAVFLCGGGGRH